ncbi:MAG: SseB family protein [Actinobacteria bacterium]|nr:SseB family protein [Actinomycetota bacterium]
MVELIGGDPRYRDDHGEPSPAVASALAAYADGSGTEHAALTALASSRLLVPVLAMPAEETAEGAGAGAGAAAGGSQMATPSLIGRDGRRAMVAFTCADAVRRWQPAARPVPAAAAAVFGSAVADSCAVVIDVAGPVGLVVDGARLAALAGGGPVPRMYEDPDVWQLVATAAGRAAPGIRVRLSAPPPGAEFSLELAPPEGVPGPVPEAVAARVADEVRELLAERVRSAVAVVRLAG